MVICDGCGKRIENVPDDIRMDMEQRGKPLFCDERCARSNADEVDD
jgi:hypothetical protein